MPHVKQSPCCARNTARLVMDEANLRRLARQRIGLEAKGRDLTKVSEAIERAKISILEDYKAISDHDASHAGVPE